MNQTLVAIVVGLAIVAGIVIMVINPWRESEVPKLLARIDSLETQVKELEEWNANLERQRANAIMNLANCEERERIRLLNVTPGNNDAKAWELVAKRRQAENDSLRDAYDREIVGKLSESLFSDPVGFSHNDGFTEFKVRAYGVMRPMEGTVELHYEMTDYALLNRQIIYQDVEVPVYVSSAYVYADLGIGRNWKQQKFQILFGAGLFADLSKTFSIDVQALRGVLVGGSVDVSTNAMLRVKF